MNINYIENLDGKLLIKNIDEIAKSGLSVKEGFRFIIFKSKNYNINDLCVLEGKFIDILNEGELIR